MSHHPAVVSLDDLELTDTAKAAVLRLARKIANGWQGKVTVIVMKGGGIRSMEWTEFEDGNTIKEELV